MLALGFLGLLLPAAATTICFCEAVSNWREGLPYKGFVRLGMIGLVGTCALIIMLYLVWLPYL